MRVSTRINLLYKLLKSDIKNIKNKDSSFKFDNLNLNVANMICSSLLICIIGSVGMLICAIMTNLSFIEFIKNDLKTCIIIETVMFCCAILALFTNEYYMNNKTKIEKKYNNFSARELLAEKKKLV